MALGWWAGCPNARLPHPALLKPVQSHHSLISLFRVLCIESSAVQTGLRQANDPDERLNAEDTVWLLTHL